MFDGDIDTQLLPLVSSINVAAGFHAGNLAIARTVRLAKEHGVGVHPGFRDLVGYGRRHINATASKLANECLYQLGAVREFVRFNGLLPQHFGLHGARYMHAARDEEFATALFEASQVADPELPILVMAGSVVEEATTKRDQPVIREFYAERHYGSDGQIVLRAMSTPSIPTRPQQKSCRLARPAPSTPWTGQPSRLSLSRSVSTATHVAPLS